MEKLKDMLSRYKAGRLEMEDVLDHLRKLPYEDLSFAKIDHHRALRRGFPEVVFGEAKSAEQIVEIVRSMESFGSNVLVTRVRESKAHEVMARIPEMTHHREARALSITHEASRAVPKGTVAVLCAGSSDIPVAEEAAVTVQFMCCNVKKFFDVGVAGLHRLLNVRDQFHDCHAFVVAAGMEGALPSVVGGLVDRPVIALPTSVGYGAAFGGIAALLGMLNSCAPGVCVVNIDNGFGAGYLAAMIARSTDTSSRENQSMNDAKK